MPNRIVWDGLDELKAWLRTLPEDLADEATGIVHDAADRARDEIYNAYPERTGNLRAGLTVRRVDGSDGVYFRAGSKALGAGAVLYNNARHAYIYEHGTEANRITDKGWDRGRMPAGNVFIPRAARQRKRMYEELKAMMQAHGLQVSGDA